MPHQPKLFQRYAAGIITTAMVGFYFTSTANAAGFSDINDNTHKEAILELVNQGVIKGFPDGTFRPYTYITRGDAAVMVARALGLLEGQVVSSSRFSDLGNSNEETREAIIRLANANIISGFDDGTFRPKENITRAQMAKYITNAFDFPISNDEPTFPDVSRNAALAPYVTAIAKAGITIGKNNGMFGYHDQLNRGDFAAMIFRAQKKDIEPINPLSIEGDNQGNNLINGSAKTYTVTLTNPVSGKPIQNAALNITFEENLHTNSFPQNNVWVTNGEGESKIPYQSDDGNQSVIKIYTDRNGKATFTITGSNAKVTPIVFLDGSNQAWDTKGGIEIRTQDGRFDEMEYHVRAEPVTFTVTPYEISVIGQRTNYAAIAQVDANGDIIEHNGREYKIRVLKPDGTPFAGGIVNVGIEELLDSDGTNDYTSAYFVDFKNTAGQHLAKGQLKLDSKGEGSFIMASLQVNDSAKPIVWIDQNFADNHQPGTLQNGEPMSDSSKVPWTNFQPIRVDNGSLGAKLEVKEEQSIGEKTFTMTFLNQSGKTFNPGKDVQAHVTFEVINTGTHRIEINTSLLNNLQLRNAVEAESKKDKVMVEVGGRVTLAGDTPVGTATLTAHAVEGVSLLQVKGSAVLFHDIGEGSNSVYVYTDFIEESLPYFYAAKIESIIAKDTNYNGTSDQIVVTFEKEVQNFEAGDFRITQNGITYSANTINKEEKKLILIFPEDAFANGTTTLKYDPHYSGTEALSDEFGNKVIAFQVGFNSIRKIESEEPSNPEEEPREEIEEETVNPIVEENSDVIKSEEEIPIEEDIKN